MDNQCNFTPLEKAIDFNRWYTDFQADGGIKQASAQTVRGRSSLMGFTVIAAILLSLQICPLISDENKEIIIRFKTTLDEAQILNVAKKHHLSLKKKLLAQQQVYLCTVMLNSEEEIEKLLETLNHSPDIEYAEPNWPVHAIDNNHKGSPHHEIES